MSVIRHISTVFRNVSYLWLIDIYSLCKELQCWEWKCVTGIFFLREGGDSNNNKVGLQVIAEKMKICSYVHVRKYPYPRYVS